MTCVAPGWGGGPWASTPWMGGSPYTPGGPVPAVAPFDIFCIEPCGSMSVFLSYSEVSEIATGAQLHLNTSQDQVFTSGGAEADTNVIVTVTVPIPGTFTADFTIGLEELPANFLDITNSHILINITDAAGPCVGLFFSAAGIGYAGGVHFDGGNNLILDSAVQTLPGSQSFVALNTYYTFRVVASQSQGLVYIYITETASLSTIGHQLRYIMPIIDAADLLTPPTDRVLFSVRGTASTPSTFLLDTICVGSQALIPNIPPIADAGADQALRMCSIAKLSGKASFDPEGAPISFHWRLLDGPTGSSFVFDGSNGQTYPLVIPSGFTDKFHSAELAALNALDPLVAGEVLVIDGEVYEVVTVGIDVNGFYVQTDVIAIPDNFTSATFKYVRQRGISEADTASPTFLADKPGFYRFDLVVFDGELESTPSVTVLNVVESAVPRGCIPDLRFVWSYLSDFWSLVEDRERVEVFWAASAQMAASELLALWQIDYSKSLKDVQRTFQRRWLSYAPFLKEELPDLVEVNPFYGAVTTDGMTGTTVAAAGTQVVLDTAMGAVVVDLVGVDPMLLTDVAAQLTGALTAFDDRFVVTSFTDTATTNTFIRITAPFPFSVADTTTFGPLAVGQTNADITGSAGVAVGSYVYKVETSLAGITLTAGNYLIVGGVGYRIKSVVSDTADTYPQQRVVLFDAIELSASSAWRIASTATSPKTNFYTALLSEGDTAVFEVTVNSNGAAFDVECAVFGVATADPAIFFLDTVPLADYLGDDGYTVGLSGVYRKNYLPISPLVVDIPYLQERIKESDDTVVLRRNIDFFLETYRDTTCIRFATGVTPTTDVWEGELPPVRLWAETTYLDNRETIEQNFGLCVDFDLDDLSQLPASVDYLSAVRGLWYAYIKGPTLFNLRAGTQILLGLPFAEEAGVITEVRTDFSPTQGRLLIQDTAHPEIVRSYTFPLPLDLEINPATGEQYVVGDTVTQFAPLVTGAEVKDYISSPKWFEGLMNQGLLFEVEKFFKFLVRVNSAAFNLSALLFIKSFILRVKPTYTYPLFLVLKEIGDTEVSVTDLLTVTGTLRLFDGACFQFNGNSSQGVATMFDEPDPSGGGWQSKFDADSDGATGDPVFPNAQPVFWGYDKNLLCPEDAILATSTVTFGAPTLPTYDSIFGWDAEVFTGVNQLVFEDSDITSVPSGAVGLYLYNPIVAGFTATLTDIEVTFDGGVDDAGVTYTIDVLVNSVVQVSFPITPTDGYSTWHSAITLNIANGDTVTARIRHNGASFVSPVWETVLVKIGQGTAWAYDTALPAGTYKVFRDL